MERIADKLIDKMPVAAVVMVAIYVVIAHGHHWLTPMIEWKKYRDAKSTSTPSDAVAQASKKKSNLQEAQPSRSPRRSSGQWLRLLELVMSLVCFGVLALFIGSPAPLTAGTAAFLVSIGAVLVVSLLRALD